MSRTGSIKVEFESGFEMAWFSISFSIKVHSEAGL